MASAETGPETPSIRIDYENLDMPPRYVEGAQGIPTPKGALQCYLFSDYVVPPQTMVPEAKTRKEGENAFAVDMRVQDPYGLQGGQMRIVRRVEANVILSEAAARELHTWLGQVLGQMSDRRTSIAKQVQPK